jgi:glycerol kinase
VDWLCDGLGLVTSPQATDAIAASVDSTDGVVFVASIQGEGTPGWDFGARGTLLGLTRGTTAPQIVRAVLEGVAFAADAVLRAAGADADLEVTELRIDGGMSENRTFVQLLANATGLEVYPSPVVEATTLGAGRAAGLALGWFSSTRDIAEATDAVDRSRIVAPSGPAINREAWRAATKVSRSWYPELSAISF